MPVEVRAFTFRYDGIANTLRTHVHIYPAFDPHIPESVHPPGREYTAIWDTGATNSVITSRVVQECGLQPTGMTQVRTVQGEERCNTYLVNLMLPNHVGVAKIRVSEGQSIEGADILIGMDIITQGDFAITHKGGKTVFSFRYPSVDCIDFVEQPPPKEEPYRREGPKIGRNAPCPCGSGKKYKRCCGR